MPGQLGGAPLCGVCDTRVYFNEQKSFMNRSWHKKCFRCTQCRKDLETGTANATDAGLYCNACVRRMMTSQAGGGAEKKAAYVDVNDAECCPRCGRRVFFAEQVLCLARKWHKSCFSCASCNKKVDSNSATDHEGELYCRPCHGRRFGPKGYGFAGGAGTMMSVDDSGEGDRESPDGSGGSRKSSVSSQSSEKKAYVNHDDAECCPRCGRRVYFAEQVLCLARKWHKSCFSCGECGKKVSSSTAADHEGALYCQPCHGRRFGPRGYGFAAGAGTLLSMDPVKSASFDDDASRSDASSSGDGVGDGRRRLSKQGSRDEYVNVNDAECCPRCGRRVFFAEQVLCLARKWHKSCFTCGACNKKVDSSSAADHEGELFCQSCHGRRFGPKGYGFAGGAGTMLSMDTGDENEITQANVPHTAEAYVAPPTGEDTEATDDVTELVQELRVEGADYCPRCNTQVFLAEQKVGAGNSYHSRCFNCLLCSKKLDSHNLTEKDSEIYCQSCYGEKFAPQGNGFGNGAGILQTSS